MGPPLRCHTPPVSTPLSNISSNSAGTPSGPVGSLRRGAPMKEMGAAVPEDQQLILSSSSPGKAQQRLALGILLGLLVVAYLINGPLSGLQFGASTAFIAIYVTAMFITELITAILLYAQFSILRSRAILVIASGYLFTALIVISYALSFTGLLAPNGLVGSLQTSGWMYVLWHCGFPI